MEDYYVNLIKQLREFSTQAVFCDYWLRKAAEAIEKLQESLEKFENPKTNADRIRAMTDEELSELIVLHGECDCGHCIAWKVGCTVSDSTCEAAWLDWLKQETKDDNT